MRELEDKYKNNLKKTLEIINLCFKLKESYIKQKNPEYTQDDVEEKIFKDILKRKNQQWKSLRGY